MPTAKFEADFSSFLAAIDKAQFKMQDMSAGADKVQKRLDAMTDTFSGRQVIQDASLMTIAIEKLGGVSKLTADELAKVGAQANAAVEKMHALGYEVPAGLQDLADATKKNVEATTEWGGAIGTLQGMLGAIGISATIGGVINLTREIAKSADEIQKFADRTQTTAENVQNFQAVSEQTGVPLQRMITAIQGVQERLGEGDQSLIGSLEKYGIAVDTLKGKNAWQMYEQIAEAIAKIEDPLKRAAAADEIFLRGKDLLPSFTADIEQLGASTTKMANESVAAWDRAGDNSTKWITSIKNSLANFIYEGTISVQQRWLDTLNAGLKQIKPLADSAADGAKGVALSMDEADRVGKSLTKTVNDQIKASEAAEKQNQKLEAAYGELAAAGDGWKGTLDKIDGSTVESIAYYRDAGVSVSALKTIYSDLGDTAFAAIEKMRQARDKQAAADLKYYDDLVKTDTAAYAALEKVNKDYNDYIAKNTQDQTTYQITKIWEQADADIKAYESKYGKSAEYTAARNALADAETDHVMQAIAKQSAASDAALQKSINDAASAANAWFKAEEVINGEIVRATVGHGPTAPNTTPIDRGETVGGLSGVHPGGSLAAVPGATLLGNSDPRVLGLLGQGYTAGEAAAIVGGYGGMISIPFGERQTRLAAAGGLGGVNININGTVLGDKDAIARVVSDSLTDLLRRQGYALPGR
jgi:hypothetical protein